MEPDRLSQNGIQKVLNNAPAIVQIIDFQTKQKGEAIFYIVQISDGFAKLKKCVIMPQTNKKVKTFDIIRTQVVTPNLKDGKPIHVLLQQYEIVRDDITQIIGEPMNWTDFQKNKTNPKGDNEIPYRKGKNNKKEGGKSNVNMSAIFDDQEDDNEKQRNPGLNKKVSEISSTQSIPYGNNKNGNNQQPAKTNINNNQPPAMNKQSMNSNAQNNNMQNKQQNKQNSNMYPPNNKNVPQNNKNNSEPRHDKSHILIKQLYEGMQDWKLKVRVMFCSEVRTYVKKANGQESQVFSFEACDRFDSIEFTAFGDSAGNFGNVIELDNVYEIAGGKVTKDDQKNKLKIMITQKTVINVLQDDVSIPMVDQFCITPEKLLQKDIGTDWNVVALVKDSNQIIEFVSKNGKNCKKKQIYLCDPEAQIQIPLTLWFQKANIQFQKIPYALQGIQVSSFNDQKQFAASIRFNYRPFKQHQFRKFVTTFEKMKLQNPVHQISGKSKPNQQLINFLVLRSEAEKLQNGNSLTMEKVCYLSQISLTSRNFYMSCPFCKRKVLDEQNGSCISDKCGKGYQKAKYRYLLNVSLSDQVQTIWATAYDEAAEIMLTSDIDGSILTADEFAKIDEEDLKLRIPGFLDRQMKVTIVAKKQTYNGQEKVKFGINKAVLNIDYTQEANNLARQIEYLMGTMQQN